MGISWKITKRISFPGRHQQMDLFQKDPKGVVPNKWQRSWETWWKTIGNNENLRHLEVPDFHPNRGGKSDQNSGSKKLCGPVSWWRPWNDNHGPGSHPLVFKDGWIIWPLYVNFLRLQVGLPTGLGIFHDFPTSWHYHPMMSWHHSEVIIIHTGIK